MIPLRNHIGQIVLGDDVVVYFCDDLSTFEGTAQTWKPNKPQKALMPAASTTK
jgi:hypothetical protein